MHAVKCLNLNKSYGPTPVLRELSLTISAGKQYLLLGPNGSGKTTLARIMSGLERPDSGTIEVSNDKLVIMVPQDFTVWPKLSALDNVALGCRKGTRGEQILAASKIMEQLGLSGLESRNAQQLSYGECQKIALARAIAHAPDVLILDEPFANLDPRFRRDAWRELASLFRLRGMTVLWISHAPDEGFRFADHVFFLSGGKLLQEGSPEDLYLRPLNKDVAAFCGELALFDIQDISELSKIFHFPLSYLEGATEIGIRPHACSLVSGENGLPLLSQAACEFAGGAYFYRIPVLEDRIISVASTVRLASDGLYKLKLMAPVCCFS